jgi:radical SAM superfamily enzyme YgiQ (UPF0313 family)
MSTTPTIQPASRKSETQRLKAERGLFYFPKYSTSGVSPAPFLPMSRKEMIQLGWDRCDIIIVTGEAYTAGNIGGKHPDRAVTVYTQRCEEAYKKPVIIGGSEASLRRIAHYDYWSDKVKRSVLFDSKADMLMFGNAERPLLEMASRFAAGETIEQMQDIRGTAVIRKEPLFGYC